MQQYSVEREGEYAVALPDEGTSLFAHTRPHMYYDDSSSLDEDVNSELAFNHMKPSHRHELKQAEALSSRLLAIPDEDSEEEDRVLRQSLNLGMDKVWPPGMEASLRPSIQLPMTRRPSGVYREQMDEWLIDVDNNAKKKINVMIWLAIIGMVTVILAFYVGVQLIGPPNQPIGPYRLLEKQEGSEFFDYYTFYEGPDSVGSNGYNTYVAMHHALDIGIVNVSMEASERNVFGQARQSRRVTIDDTEGADLKKEMTESFVYLNSAPTEAGPRSSIRLEGNRRFDRGLFIIDLRHMPAGCGVWPAFWLTDEP
jgi:hypothetical protein